MIIVRDRVLFSPENRRVTLRYLGIEDMNDLDSEQTMKQLLEIEEILNLDMRNDRAWTICACSAKEGEGKDY